MAGLGEERVSAGKKSLDVCERVRAVGVVADGHESVWARSVAAGATARRRSSGPFTVLG